MVVFHLLMLYQNLCQIGLFVEAYRTVYAGIIKELKATQKRVWPTYPIQVGVYSLLYFGHAKVEAPALEYIALSSIEFKRNYPHKVVENHLAQFSMKKVLSRRFTI